MYHIAIKRNAFIAPKILIFSYRQDGNYNSNNNNKNITLASN